ncbi:MAG: prepilin-type N-terminal cleavage/methylation domain-containing protein [Syntrophomonadaceae bacterium]
MLMKFNALFKKARDQKGFTLVELLVVMAILAVLAALAVPKFGQMLEDSKYKTHDENVVMLYKAAEMYIASNGNPTTAIADTAGMTTLKTAGFISDASLKTPYNSATGYTVAIATTGAITVTPGKATKSATDGTWSTAASYVGP